MDNQTNTLSSEGASSGTGAYSSIVLHAAPAKHLQRLPRAAAKGKETGRGTPSPPEQNEPVVPADNNALVRGPGYNTEQTSHHGTPRHQHGGFGKRIQPNKAAIEAVSEMIFPNKLRKRYTEYMQEEQSRQQQQESSTSGDQIQQASTNSVPTLERRPLGSFLANHVGESDFLAPSSYFKNILKAPFTGDPVSLSLHRIGGTILVEAPPSKEQYQHVLEEFVDGVRHSLPEGEKFKLQNDGDHSSEGDLEDDNGSSALDMQSLDNLLADSAASEFGNNSSNVSPSLSEASKAAMFVVNTSESQEQNSTPSIRKADEQVNQNLIRGILEYSNSQLGPEKSSSYVEAVKRIGHDTDPSLSKGEDRPRTTRRSASFPDDSINERSTILLRAPTEPEPDSRNSPTRIRQTEMESSETALVSNSFPRSDLDGHEIEAIASASAYKGEGKSARPNVEESLNTPVTTPASLRRYQRVTRWQFGSHSIVLGSDLMTFCNDPDSGIMSLALRDTSVPLSRDECLDLYLENELAGVSDVAFCYHKAGNIQGYELVPTSQVLNLANVGSQATSFSEETFKAQAKELLDFLRVNCSEDNSSYWLLREANESVLRLYTLSSDATNPTRRRKWRYMLAMMCYRFAKQLDQEIYCSRDNAHVSSHYISQLYSKRGELLRRCSSLLLELEEEAQYAEDQQPPKIGADSGLSGENNIERNRRGISRSNRQQNAFMRAAVHQELAENRLCSGIFLIEGQSTQGDSDTAGHGLPKSVEYLNEAMRHIFASLQLFAEGVRNVIASSIASIVATKEEEIRCGIRGNVASEIAENVLRRPQLSDCMEKVLKLRKQVFQVALLISRALQRESMPRLGLRSLNDAIIIGTQSLGTFLAAERFDDTSFVKGGTGQPDLFHCSQMQSEVMLELPRVLMEESDHCAGDNKIIYDEQFSIVLRDTILELKEYLDSSISIASLCDDILPVVIVNDTTELLYQRKSADSQQKTNADVELMELVGDMFFTILNQKSDVETQLQKSAMSKLDSLRSVFTYFRKDIPVSIETENDFEPETNDYISRCCVQVQKLMIGSTLPRWDECWSADYDSEHSLLQSVIASYRAVMWRCEGTNLHSVYVRCCRKYADALNRYGRQKFHETGSPHVWMTHPEDEALVLGESSLTESLRYYAEAARAFDRCGDSLNSALVRCNMVNTVLLIGRSLRDFTSDDSGITSALYEDLRYTFIEISIIDIGTSIIKEALSTTNGFGDRNVIYAVLQCMFKCYILAVSQIWSFSLRAVQTLRDAEGSFVQVNEVLRSHLEDLYKAGTVRAGQAHNVASESVPSLAQGDCRANIDMQIFTTHFHVARMHFFYALLRSALDGNEGSSRNIQSNKAFVALRLSSTYFTKCRRMFLNMSQSKSPETAGIMLRSTSIFIDSVLLDCVVALLVERLMIARDLASNADLGSCKSLFSRILSNADMGTLHTLGSILHKRLVECVRVFEQSELKEVLPDSETSEESANKAAEMRDCCTLFVKSLLTKLTKTDPRAKAIETVKQCYKRLLYDTSGGSFISVFRLTAQTLGEVNRRYPASH
eukprot:gb/GECG01005887.1/.p1 GENE.gb/GECG01005887.1/~~gb/GECG01005887.1/.p1  ORF type:complete len:1562 (+),score=209.73 gb/GECG01005887.1/:1-4686(+)